MNFPVIILGGGGHAKVLIEALRASSVSIIGITDPKEGKKHGDVLGVPVLGDDSIVERHPPGSVLLVNGVGSVSVPKARKTLFDTFKHRGYDFATVIHPSAVVASDVALGEGSQVMAGVVIQPGCRIGKNVVVNTNSTVDHDCIIGNHVHLSPGVTLSGGVRVGDVVHVGTGATVIQGVSIGSNSIVGAGSVVIKDVHEDAEVVGVPARNTTPASHF